MQNGGGDKYAKVQKRMKGFVIAGTGSGSGKTTITLGLLAYLSGLGYRVAPFKVGPDFIDPGHHTAVTGKISRNLDSWMLSKETNERIFAKGCIGNIDIKCFNIAGGSISDFNKESFDKEFVDTVAEIADVAVVEGVMGLFDGYSGTSEAGSTAQMAKWLHLPVVLVVDARSMARSAAAIVQGFENFDPEIEFAGVIFSKTGSQRHYEYLKEAVEANCRMRCIGHLPRTPEIAMPERHLGLVTSDEHKLSSEVIAKIVDMIDKNTSIRAMVESLPEHNLPDCRKIITLKSLSIIDTITDTTVIPPRNLRIAVARDKAFCFYYQENIEALEKYGAEIVEFSPIESKHLPPYIHGIYFGGGYPELFAQQLSDNKGLMDEIRERSLQGMPIYGECGGFMYLCRDIVTVIEIDQLGKRYPMTGCFPFSAVMSKKMRSLGYRQITLKQDSLIGKMGDLLRGHEFHYSSLEDENMDNMLTENSKQGDNQIAEQGKLKRIYDTAGRDGQEISLNGYQINNTLGSYLHIHFESMEGGAALTFVNCCREFCNLSESSIIV